MERLTLANDKDISYNFDDGTVVNLHRIQEEKPVPGTTADHETAHVLVEKRIKRATIVASGNALGTTIPEVITPAGAAAGAAIGDEKGSGWDRVIVEEYFGVPWNSAKAGARAELSGQEEVFDELASTFQQKKTITQTDVNEAQEAVAKKRKGIHLVAVEVISPEGKKEQFETESKNNTVQVELVEGEWSTLKAA